MLKISLNPLNLSKTHLILLKSHKSIKPFLTAERTKHTFKTSRLTNPLCPAYLLPSSLERQSTPPKFIYDRNQLSNLHNNKGYRNLVIPDKVLYNKEKRKSNN
jgi:hypothetical protein